MLIALLLIHQRCSYGVIWSYKTPAKASSSLEHDTNPKKVELGQVLLLDHFIQEDLISEGP